MFTKSNICYISVMNIVLISDHLTELHISLHIPPYMPFNAKDLKSLDCRSQCNIQVFPPLTSKRTHNALQNSGISCAASHCYLN